MVGCNKRQTSKQTKQRFRRRRDPCRCKSRTKLPDGKVLTGSRQVMWDALVKAAHNDEDEKVRTHIWFRYHKSASNVNLYDPEQDAGNLLWGDNIRPSISFSIVPRYVNGKPRFSSCSSAKATYGLSIGKALEVKPDSEGCVRCPGKTPGVPIGFYPAVFWMSIPVRTSQSRVKCQPIVLAKHQTRCSPRIPAILINPATKGKQSPISCLTTGVMRTPLIMGNHPFIPQRMLVMQMACRGVGRFGACPITGDGGVDDGWHYPSTTAIDLVVRATSVGVSAAVADPGTPGS